MLGDIHGAHKALLQCLQRAAFDYETDHLIALGDVADGWPETKKCIDELLKIKNLTFIFGNHDFWTLEWMESGTIDDVWYSQGGKATIDSYQGTIPPEHIAFLRRAHPYFKLNDKVFVHAGVMRGFPLEHHSMQTLLWDRNLSRIAIDRYRLGEIEKLTDFEAVYVGHTPITGNKPIKACDVWLMDTGAGWSGVLSIMDVESEEYFTSDPVPELYPGIEGRKKRT